MIQIDGRMVERLHADMARRTVAIADAIAQSAGGLIRHLAMTNLHELAHVFNR